MKHWHLVLATVASLGVGLVGGWYLSTSGVIGGGDNTNPSPPAPSASLPKRIIDACREFEAVYEAAEKDADKANLDAVGQELAHPYSAPDMWNTERQAQLERAAKKAVQASESRWWPITYSLENAARVMNPANAGISEDSSRVGQQEALSNAHAACLSR